MTRTAAPPPARSSRRKLGRGLSSLISTPVRVDVAKHSEAETNVTPKQQTPAESASDSPAVVLLAVDKIVPNPHQPRQAFNEASLQAMAASVQSSGVMQPILVRKAEKNQYQIVAGERRWRAARLAELTHVPAIVRELDNKTAAEFSLIENIQREDLNPMERAEAFHHLAEEFSMTHGEIAERVGMDRSSVTNHVRLRELESSIQEAVRIGRLSMGHARALLAIRNASDQKALAEETIRLQWSVRSLETRVKQALKSNGGVTKTKSGPKAIDVNTADLERRLTQHLGTRVHLRLNKTKSAGRVIIEFFDHKQFEGLMERLNFDLGS